MQNLTKFLNRRYVVLRNIISFSSSRRDIGLDVFPNLKQTNASGDIKLRLPVLRKYRILNVTHKGSGIKDSGLQNYLNVRCCLLKSDGSRNFSSSCLRYEKQEDKKSKNDNKSSNANRSSNENRSSNDDKSSDDEKEHRKNIKFSVLKLMTVLFLGVSIMVIAIDNGSTLSETRHDLTWEEFVHNMLAKGEVAYVEVDPSLERVVVHLYQGAIVNGSRVQNPTRYLQLGTLDGFEEKLRRAERRLGIQIGSEVSVVYNRNHKLLDNLVWILLLCLPLLLFYNKGFFQNGNPFLKQWKGAKFTLIDPTTKNVMGVRFEDVAGLKEAKIEIMEFVDYLKDPGRYNVLGGKVPKGALLLGPPGCGKTLLAKAVATEANVSFLSMNGSEFVELLGGLGASRVRDLFREGKKRAPSIIYIDEIDAIGKKRSGSYTNSSNDESDRTLNQLLVEMDGMNSTENVIVLSSTNRADVLDKALLRPGRFDRHILIDLPTLAERKEIFEYYLKKLILQQDASKYSDSLAYMTPGFTGADIANVCNEAALYAARYKKKIVEGSDLLYAIDKMIGGTRKTTNMVTASMKRVIAYHEAGHALVGWLLKHTGALLKVTIVPRTNMSLGLSQYTESDRKLQSKEELCEKMCMMLAGRAAESLVYNEITTGAQNDLEKVTKLAYLQVQQYGMSSTLGLLSFDEECISQKTKKPYSKKLGNLMDAEARRLIAEAYAEAQKILADNREKLEKLTAALLEKETLTYNDVEKLIGPPPFVKKRLIDLVEFETGIPIVETPTVNPPAT